MVHPPDAGPTQPDERIEVIDILRGFALFGILLVNMIYFAYPVYREVLDLALWSNPLDRAASWLIGFFAEGKFFTLFSLLFGLGLAIQMQRARAKGARIVPRFLRRLAVLLVIGLAHAFLFWWGDILIYYALLGSLLLLFRNTAPRKLLAWALVFLVIPLAINTSLVGLLELGRGTPEGAAQIQITLLGIEAQNRAAYEQAFAVYSGRGFTAMIPQRLADWSFATFGVLLNGMLFLVLAMFLIGLYAGKRQLLHHVPEHLPFLRRVLVWGAVVGVLGNLLYMTLASATSPFEPSWASLAGLIGYLVGAPALSMTYASGFVLLTHEARWRGRLSPLAAVGRTALSNYLLQTLICTTLFYGYGLGLYGQIGPATGLVLTLLIFGAQIYVSTWWVKRFHFGPFEWLWRTLTYGQLQPLRFGKSQPSSTVEEPL